MATVRDSLLPAVDSIRAFESTFGTRRFDVTIRRRAWSGSQPGEGVATDYNIHLVPRPRVRDITTRNMTPTEAEMIAMNSGRVTGNIYRVDLITPAYKTATVSGGYTAEQMRLWPNRDTGAVENLIAMVGDDGYLRECVQASFEQDRAFRYTMIVVESNRPRTSLQSVSVTPSAPSLTVGKTQQLVATGTFSGGDTSILTLLTAWDSSNSAVAIVDIYGVVTAIAPGACVISANVLGIQATANLTVS